MRVKMDTSFHLVPILLWHVGNLTCVRSVQSAVCACKQLRSISIRHSLVPKAQPCESELLEALLISLPELRALQFKEVSSSHYCMPLADACLSTCCHLEVALGTHINQLTLQRQIL